MINVRRANERGRSDLGWLDSRHTFSFGRYVDRQHMGFRSLRVINEDRIGPGGGFPDHPHRDMEIITYILQGVLEHRDNTGNHSQLTAGELQRMTAGTGIVHSEFNASSTAPAHLYQIWIQPGKTGLDPGYEQWRPAGERMDEGLVLVASPDGRDGSLTIHQDAEIHLGRIAAGQTLAPPLRPGRHVWLQVLRGAVEVGGERLEAGDAASASEPISVRGSEEGQIMLFDLA